MNPKKASPKKAGGGASRGEEWTPSHTGEAELERLVTTGVLPDRVTTGWRPASGEPFPMPNTDEVVVFEDYFMVWIGVPCSSFPARSVGILVDQSMQSPPQHYTTHLDLYSLL